MWFKLSLPFETGFAINVMRSTLILVSICAMALHAQYLHDHRGGPAGMHPPSRVHDSFIQHFQGGQPAFNEAIRERADWNPLQIFEYAYYPDYNPQWSKKWDRFNALGPVLQCPKEILSSFGQGDGEKRICGFVEGEHCVIISIGRHDDWDFEVDMIKKHPHCRVHTFDCTVLATVPAAVREQVTFYHQCLGITDYTLPNGQEYLSWPSMVRKIGLTQPPTALKMDIEGFEWTTIPAIIKSNVHVPESFSFELHFGTPIKEMKWINRERTDPEIGLFSEMLFSFGYVLVDRHDNELCPQCSEVVMAKLIHPCSSDCLRNTNVQFYVMFKPIMRAYCNEKVGNGDAPTLGVV
jgi:hypothetical protein